MSSVNGVNGSAGVAGMDALDVTGLSPDAIIGFCEMQLNNYGAQISDLVSQQKQSMADQGVISNLKSQLEQQGKPTNAKQMNQVYNDYQTALAQLPDGDPAKQQLQKACDDMCNTYGYTPPTPLNDTQVSQLQFDQKLGAVPIVGSAFQTEAQQLRDQATVGTLANPPSDAQWQGTVDDVGSVASNLNGQSQIQMLQLNQLSSMNQTAVEQAIQLVGKVDSTLLDEAKAI